MPIPEFAAIQVGDIIPALEKPPITRHTLALFCGASNDHNPIHVDIDFAKQAGAADVFAHGMLVMAYLGQMLTHWVPQQSIRSFGVRFTSITHLTDLITCRGTVVEKFEQDGELLIRLQLIASNQTDDVKLQGEAVISLN